MLTEKRYKELMQEVGTPSGMHLLRVLRKCAREAALAEREACAKIAERFEPDEKLDYVSYPSREIRGRRGVAGD